MQLFLRGIVLPFQKGAAPDAGITDMPVTQPVRVPLSRTEDVPPTLTVTEDAPLSVGDELCRADSLPVLSTVAGTFAGTVVLNHPLYGELLCAELQPDGDSRSLLPVISAESITPEDILQAAIDACIYDELDGSPLAEKLARWQLPANDRAALRTILVADATENDIYGSSAWAVLEEQSEAALLGLQMAARCLRFSRYHIATMLPRPRRRALKRRIGRENVYTVGDEYPVTVYADGRDEVFRIGVQACVALGRAVQEGHRHTHTVITVAGDGLTSSRNLRVPFGTDLSEILAFCKADPHAQVVLGDAMTGTVCEDIHTPLLPGVTTILVMKEKPVRIPGPCMGCGRCVSVCHAGLLPYEIVRRLENMHYERLQHLSTTACDGCGACSYICPAGRDVAAEVLRAGETRGTMFLSWGDEDNE